MNKFLMKHKAIVIVIAIILVAVIGFAAGMLAKTSIADNNKDIGISTAKEIALASVGVSLDKATFTKEQADDSVYEIDFYTASNEYDFEIDKRTGAITDREVSPRELPPATEPEPVTAEQTEPAAQSNNDDDVIGVAAAKDVALTHAGLNSASFQEVSLDYDDGLRVYDLEFVSGNKTYDYEINAHSGSIISYDVEAMEYDDYYDD